MGQTVTMIFKLGPMNLYHFMLRRHRFFFPSCNFENRRSESISLLDVPK